MTLQSSGAISASDINTELGETAGAQLSLNSSEARDLAGISSGAIALSDFYDRGLVMQTDSRQTPATSHTSVSFGEDTTGRRILVLATHGNTGGNPGSTPTATIGGVAATRITAHSTGDGAGTATGMAMFTADPTGDTGTVAVSWGGLAAKIVVLRIVSYDLTSAFDAFAAGSATDVYNTDIPAKGLLVAAVSRSTSVGTTWVGVTEQSDTNTLSWAWDYNMTAETNRLVGYAPFTGTAGKHAWVVASFSKSA